MKFGYDNAVFSGLIISSWFLATFNHPNPGLLGTVSALYNIGCAGGAVVAFFVGGLLGRRKTLLVGSGIATAGVIVQATSQVIGQLLTGRILTGIGVGILTSTIGLWQAETSPPATRGRYMTMELLLGGLGVVSAQYINYGMRNNTSRFAFVFPIAFQCCWIIGTAIGVTLLPESPSWLFRRGREQECLDIIIRLHGGDATADSPGVQMHILEIQEANELEVEGEGKSFFSGIFTNKPTMNFKRICFGTGIMILHQFNGINSVTYYVPTLVVSYLGSTHDDALWIAGFTGVIAVVFSIIPVLYVDRFGRRRFLWIGSAAQAVAFSVVAALIATLPKGGSKAYGIATIAFIYIYYAINITSWYPITWLYPAELMPLRIREKGMGIAVFFYWIFQFLIVEITPVALTNIGYKFYIMFVVFNICIAVIIFLCYPETKGMSLEQIDFFFAPQFQHSSELARAAEKNAREGGDSYGLAEQIEHQPKTAQA